MTYEEEQALIDTADANGGEYPKAYRRAWESACERARAAEGLANRNALDGIELGKVMMRDRIVAYFNDRSDRSSDFLYRAVAKIIENIA